MAKEAKPQRRCMWADNNPLMAEYHDKEWGVPVHDDKKLFEFLTLEGAQAGLTWQTVLNRRENYRKAFSGFDAAKVARYNSKDAMRLLQDIGIIRNRLKISATILNAKKFLKIQEEFGSFDAYIWQFSDGKQIDPKYTSLKAIPATTRESDAMSKDLIERGFTFVGSTICYAFMQAIGMTNDHTLNCFRHSQI